MTFVIGEQRRDLERRTMNATMISSTSAYSSIVLRNKQAAGALAVGERAKASDQTSTSSITTGSVSELQRALETRDYLEQTLESAGQDDKAQAMGRLEQAKQRLAMLKRWGFNPEVVARGAAQLAREVGAAAGQFVSALAADAAAEPAFAKAGLGSSTVATAIPQAYREAMERGLQAGGISQGDRETIEAFKSVARQIKQLLDRALRELRQQKSLQGIASEAEHARASIEDAISALDGATNEMPLARATAFSITI